MSVAQTQRIAVRALAPRVSVATMRPCAASLSSVSPSSSRSCSSRGKLVVARASTAMRHRMATKGPTIGAVHGKDRNGPMQPASVCRSRNAQARWRGRRGRDRVADTGRADGDVHQERSADACRRHRRQWQLDGTARDARCVRDRGDRERLFTRRARQAHRRFR